MIWREAGPADVPVVVALLADDVLGQGRESVDPAPYLRAFEAMRAEGSNHLIVGETDGQIIASYQITFISGLSLAGSRRAQIEGVRVAASHRGRGIGEALIRDAETRARAAGCRLVQLTTSRSRGDARRFYHRLGFTASHIGYKKVL